MYDGSSLFIFALVEIEFRDHELLDNMCYQMRPRPPTFWKAPLLLPSQISKGVVFQIINLGLFAFIINFEGLLKKGKIHSLCFIYDSPSGGSIWTYWALSGPDALQKGRSWNWILCHVFSISSKKMLFNNLFFKSITWAAKFCVRERHCSRIWP